MAKIKRLPYGISDFRQVRRENLYYVDKTMYLPQMEDAGHFLFLIRPRRFGKSIFLNMMKAYYDVNERENFSKTFEALWIADHPTEWMGQYQVLHLDFSKVSGNIDVLEERFGKYCNKMLDDFIMRYAPFYDDDYVKYGIEETDYSAKFTYIDNAAKRFGHQLYLIVDEYDNFTNTVLNEHGEKVYHDLTHASGFYRDVFKLFKGMFERILMMGVSPVTLDDLTSGYNIATDISMEPEFNLMLGFSETDLRDMIRYYQSNGLIKADENTLLAEMKPWYDNYCFSKQAVTKDPKMFNCDMVLYYLNSVIKTGASPESMIDRNTRTDYVKMKRLLQLDQLDGNRKGMLHQIAEDGYIYAIPNQSFPAENLAKPENFISLLLYYGMLTIGGVDGADLKLIIPNNNVRKQYYGYLLEEFQAIVTVDTSVLAQAYKKAALHGDWKSMVEEIAMAYTSTTSVRQLIEGERNIQGFMNAYLTLNPYYQLAPEMELNHGYCDFFLMPDHIRYPMVRHSYIIELKYLKTDASQEEAKRQWEEATEQIRDYAKAPMVKTMKADTELHLIIIQFRGYKLEKSGSIEL